MYYACMYSSSYLPLCASATVRTHFIILVLRVEIVTSVSHLILRLVVKRKLKFSGLSNQQSLCNQSLTISGRSDLQR